MKFKYQLILIGNDDTFKNKVVDTFLLKVQELGLDNDSIKIIYNTNFDTDYKANCPTVCAYFGKGGLHTDIDFLDQLITDAVFILPIVSNLTIFSSLVPA